MTTTSLPLASQLALCAAALSGLAGAQTCDVRLQGADIDGNEAMGAALYHAGDRVFSGAPGERGTTAGEILGALYVHQKSQFDGQWNQFAKIQPPSLGQRDRFGSSVDGSGFDLAVGAPGETGPLAFDTGKVYVLRNTGFGATWDQVALLTPLGGQDGDDFGAAVAMVDDFLIVGSPGHDIVGQDRGAAYVFKRVSGIWIQSQKLFPPAGVSGVGFGSTVTMDGILACIGGDQLNATSVGGGALGVYRLNAAEMFEEVQVIQPSEVGAADFFGRSASISGDLLAVGAPGDDDVAGNAGAVYTFRYDSGLGAFGFEQKILVQPSDANDNLGSAVDTDGTTVLAGASGVNGTGGAVAFRQVAGAWTELRKVRPLALGTTGLAGEAVAIVGDRALLGDASDNASFFGAGATFVVDVSQPDADDDGATDGCEDFGTIYCSPAEPNSTGSPAAIVAGGSPFVADQNLTLLVSDLPTFVFGYFLMSQTQDFIANPAGSQGNLCLGGTIGRLIGQVASSGSSGEIGIAVDLSSLPNGLPASVQAGDTWSFQLWYRDVNPSTTSNFSDAVSVDFL